jgi:hypothetical protein
MMPLAKASDLCAFRRGRRPALPAGRPSSENPCNTEKGGGSWGNHGFPHVG